MRTIRHPFALIAATLALAPFLSAQPQLLETWSYSPESATAAGETVTIPHTWNAMDIQSGKGTDMMSKDGYRRAASWYHRDLPAATPGKRVFIRFGAVSSVAGVFLNGEKIGEHRGPSTAFAFELTRQIEQNLTIDSSSKPTTPGGMTSRPSAEISACPAESIGRWSGSKKTRSAFHRSTSDRAV